jgi:hypothetical protein
LVRTHLIVATRLSETVVQESLEDRHTWPTALWAHVSPEAASPISLLGAAFPEKVPEAAFVGWLTNRPATNPIGIQVRSFNLKEDYASLRLRASRRTWFRSLERADERNLPLFAGSHLPTAIELPAAVRDFLGNDFRPTSITSLEDAGIRVGQGLRTGCNSFFYVDLCRELSEQEALVRSSAAYGEREFTVPTETIRPVLRRQSELTVIESEQVPQGRVLDLRHWVLPEDVSLVVDAEAAYRASGESVPSVMPAELAEYVRLAARLPLEDRGSGKRAPELSAVRTNIRPHREGALTPRFWYMLPDFAPRHLPAAFVARVIGGAPWVEKNLSDPILVDANFSTFWSRDGNWSAASLKALFNSAWCRLLMESLGTPMGGGALKLEASHLRRVSIPVLSKAARQELSALGAALRQNCVGERRRIDEIVFEALCGESEKNDASQLALAMAHRADALRRIRQRIAA